MSRCEKCRWNRINLCTGGNAVPRAEFMDWCLDFDFIPGIGCCHTCQDGDDSIDCADKKSIIFKRPNENVWICFGYKYTENAGHYLEEFGMRQD